MGLIVAALVVACAVMTLILVFFVLRRELREIVIEDAHTAEKPLPAWAYVERMDVPGKYPALQTRRSRVIS